MSFTKTIHISELNLIRLKVQAHINKSKSIEQELDSILNKQLSKEKIEVLIKESE